MQHARPDYMRIQDPLGVIPFSEPVFLIRAKDSVGSRAVRYWAQQAAIVGAHPTIVDAAMMQADAMDAWPVKEIPDLLPQETKYPTTSLFTPEQEKAIIEIVAKAINEIPGVRRFLQDILLEENAR